MCLTKILTGALLLCICLDSPVHSTLICYSNTGVGDVQRELSSSKSQLYKLHELMFQATTPGSVTGYLPTDFTNRFYVPTSCEEHHLNRNKNLKDIADMLAVSLGTLMQLKNDADHYLAIVKAERQIRTLFERYHCYLLNMNVWQQDEYNRQINRNISEDHIPPSLPELSLSDRNYQIVDLLHSRVDDIANIGQCLSNPKRSSLPKWPVKNEEKRTTGEYSEDWYRRETPSVKRAEPQVDWKEAIRNRLTWQDAYYNSNDDVANPDQEYPSEEEFDTMYQPPLFKEELGQAIQNQRFLLDLLEEEMSPSWKFY